MICPVKCLVLSALAATVVNGHGWMTKPAATFSAQAGDKSQFIATIESSTSGFKGTFNADPADNVASFTKAFASSKYKSLKALIDDKAKITVSGATLTCGNAEPDATAQPLPATVEWSHSDSEGFSPTHEGPCEVWCDNERAFQDENCAAHFTSAPAELPYEKSKCTGASVLTFYWMAMHGPTWQVYVNCALLSGGSGGGATTQSSGSSATTTTDSSSAGSPPAQTPSTGGSPSTPTTDSSSAKSPAAQTPSSGGSPSTPTTDSSSADTPTVTAAPSSGSTPSTTTAPSSNTSPSTSTTTAPSTSTTDESDCGSYDVAGGEEDCGSYDVAGGEEDCGSYDVAGGSGDEGQDTGAPPSTSGNTYQQSSNTGGNNYQQSSNTGDSTYQQQGGNTYQQGSTNTGANTNQWTNTGGNTNQWTNTGGNTNQWSNTGGNTNQWTNTGTGSQQNSYNFNTFHGATNAGTVAPQYM